MNNTEFETLIRNNFGGAYLDELSIVNDGHKVFISTDDLFFFLENLYGRVHE